MSTPPSCGTRETLHIHRKVKSGLKVRIMLGHNESCSSQKPSVGDSSWLRGACTPKGASQGRSGVEKKPDNWLKVKTWKN